MNLVSVEVPTTRVAAAGETVKLLDAALCIVAASQALEILADKLVDALPKDSGFLASTG
jgi:hypothetical protein